MQSPQSAPDLPAHKLTLDGRQKLTVSGVTDVERFDETAVVLHTALGTLIIRGEGLTLQKLSLDGGEVRIDGEVSLIGYENPTPSGGFFRRLFA